MATTRFTAWLGTIASVLDQENIDVVVLEDDHSGDPAFTAITGIPAEGGDHEAAQREAEELLSAAGWSTVGTWDGVDTGYTITVER
ncbi:hypothetical protein ACFWJS_33880 [Streptomyces sp. NPDC127061]|uniref:hypothetical protein n=1 Tax=Streptomyces sp. NPDC127061 TaxID=3347122 RepID=UPI003657D017